MIYIMNVKCTACVLVALFVCVSGEQLFETRPKMMEELQRVLTELAGQGRAFLGRVAGEQTILSVQKAFSQVIGVVAESLAAGLNVIFQYFSQFLKAAGFRADLQLNRVTPEGLLFVAKWVILALIAYWLFSLSLRLITSTLRQTMWLLKVCLALAGFAFILSDDSVSTETMAFRVAGLVCLCVLLGVGSSGRPDTTAHLESQVKVLEKKVREMEKYAKKRRDQ